MKIIKRNGSEAVFDISKIIAAITKANNVVDSTQRLTKEQILEAYLNVIYLGGSNYGIKIAAQDYFGKELNELSLRECACLAAIIRNPYRYNPRRNYYVYEDSHLIDDRTDYVLDEMLDQQLITQEEHDQAITCSGLKS